MRLIILLLIGRLVYEKGFQIALDALPRVIARLDGVRFLVAGSGTHEAELKAQAAARPRAPRQLPGWIGDDVLRSLYRSPTVRALDHEPSGSSPPRRWPAAACIVADTGGLREVVPNEDVGLRPLARPRSLAQMREVLANPALRPPRHRGPAQPASTGRTSPTAPTIYDAPRVRGAKRRPATLGRTL
jgi:glycogen(starch) synthase